ncbi:ABC transporter substrate-binding protein [Alcanivorax sp. N3-2A]|nr:ABC transporter substrate-binding protein [Alcanivorax sp. N3-2A]|tara:strand:- start:7639 stop:8799 length:1161 start_codon:yes stop_codon:yes gene_type:complete
MDRRKFVSALGLGLGATALAACGQKEESAKQDAASTAAAGTGQGQDGAKTYEWDMVTTWPRNYPGLGTGANRFAERVEKMTNGRMKIKVHGAGELVPAMGVFDAVRSGSAQMGHAASYYWKGKHPATQFFTAVPFGMTGQELNAWVNFGGGQALWDELYAQFNMKPFACGNSGTQMAGWFNKEINSLEDIKGLKIRMPGLAGEVIQRLGAIPVQMPGGEVFTALQTGALDAADWVSPYNDLAFGLYKVVKYYYYPSWQEPGAMLELTINKEQWDGLPADLQSIIANAAEAENQRIYDEFTARNADALKQLVDEHGVKLRRLPEDVLMALKETSDKVVADLVANNPEASKVYDSYRSFRDSILPSIAVAEQAALNARSRVLGREEDI